MKNIIASALGLVGLLSVSSASAIVITETYSYSGTGDFDANSTLTENEYLNFRFDMNNANSGVAPASFALTEDSVGADAYTPWLSGSLNIDLYSSDVEFEMTSLNLVAFNASTFEVIVIDAFQWNRDSLADPIYNVNYDFTSAEMGVFNDWGLANVYIGAQTTGLFGNYNDFAVSRVSLSVSDAASSVPEPSTLLLLSAGILGFGATSRYRKKS